MTSDHTHKTSAVSLPIFEQLIHPDLNTDSKRIFYRHAARAIVMRGEQILMLFTERYNDYSFPGGGLDDGEDWCEGLKRELEEETGAHSIRVLSEYARVDETRPHYKPDFDQMHMISHYFVCEIADDLREARMEDYEVANGMRPVWINIHDALAHNESVMARNEKKMGLSIQRETLILRHLVKQLLAD
ncbi:NUDIX domain-containing protein [Nitrincola sp. MINF-07-Sa-05]|uniref:NUDIX domain-containing protein n=1 Tax=Nitrincola salilacus TaxID=3400273 RepID=UPI0039183DBA